MKKILLLALTTFLSVTQAAELTFNGFGSVRGGYLSQDGNTNPLIQNYYTEGDSFSFKDETLFALQAQADLGKGFGVTIQMHSKGRDDFELEAQWAYVSYEIDENFKVLIGRQALPLFKQSEYEFVGYAHNYSTLPKSVYFGFDFNTVEGISLQSSHSFGDWYVTSKLLYGTWDGDIFLSTVGQEFESSIEDTYSISGSAQWEWLTLSGGYIITETDFSAIDSVLSLSMSPFIAISEASEAEIDNFNQVISQSNDATYGYLGVTIDYNNFLFETEYAQYVIDDSSDAQNDVYFVSLGYRMDKHVVTVHYEDYQQDIDLTTLDSVTNPILNQAGTALFNSQGAREFDGYGINYRYDISSGIAFKAGFVLYQDERPEVDKFSVTTAGLDFIF